MMQAASQPGSQAVGGLVKAATGRWWFPRNLPSASHLGRQHHRPRMGKAPSIRLNLQFQVPSSLHVPSLAGACHLQLSPFPRRPACRIEEEEEEEEDPNRRESTQKELQAEMIHVRLPAARKTTAVFLPRSLAAAGGDSLLTDLSG